MNDETKVTIKWDYDWIIGALIEDGYEAQRKE